MKRVVVSGRVTEAQASALRDHAEAAGLTVYQATVRALELGIAMLVAGQRSPSVLGAPAKEAGMGGDGLADAIGELLARAEQTDALLRRSLYAAGAAYAAGLATATSGEAPDRVATIKADIALDADAIFERQIAKALER